MVEIDIDDAIDRLTCMSREIVLVGPMNKILNDSQLKDKALLISLIPLVRVIGHLGQRKASYD